MLRKLHHRGAARFLGHSMSSRASTGFPPTGIGQNNTQKTITRTSQAGNGRKYPTFRCSGAHRSCRVEDCCRAGENLILSAHARGLGTCWVGSPLLWLRTASIKAELGIPPDLVPGAAICLGYPPSIPEAAPHEWPTIIWAK